MAKDTRIEDGQGDAEDSTVLVAKFDNREFRLEPGSEERAARVRNEIGRTLRVYQQQRKTLKQRTRQIWRGAAADNHIQACEILIEALKAIKSEKDLRKSLREPVNGKPGRTVILKSPWNLMDFVAKYAEEHWVQTSDVTFPDGRPEGVLTLAEVEAAGGDDEFGSFGEAEDDGGESEDGEAAETVAAGDFGDE